MSQPGQPWEPNPQKLGNWTAMFEPSARATSSPASPAAATTATDGTAELPGHDPSEYRPWTLQRGQSRPTMMLDLRRFEPKSGFWTGWQLAYSHLVAVEYIGDRMLSLDFGTRQFVIEGGGLDELARHFQQGSVVTIQEHAPSLWPNPPGAAVVTRIRQVDQSSAP
jgi:hypothetical protein